MNGLTHEEYVYNTRQDIVTIAQNIIKKNINIIDGCIKINALWDEAELPHDDSYYLFVLIDSDTDTFPRGYLREICSEEYLKEQDEEEKNYLKAFEKDIDEECQKLIKEYG